MEIEMHNESLDIFLLYRACETENLDKVVMPHMASCIDFIPDNESKKWMEEMNDSEKEEFILGVVENYFGVKPNNTRRQREQVEYRQVSMYFLKKYTNLSLKDIGWNFRKSHCTVMHSLNCINNLLETNKPFREKINELDIIFKM